MSYKNLANQFDQQFELILIKTPKTPKTPKMSNLLAEVYRIRYQVYCKELQFEPAEAYPHQMEVDEYDGQSIHCLLKHRASGLYAGCVRVVKARPPLLSLPLEQVCKDAFFADAPILTDIPRDSICEVSRLAVIGQFRKRKGEYETAAGVGEDSGLDTISEDDRRIFPIIALSLYLAAANIALEIGLDYSFVMMEPRLTRHLRRLGLNFCQIGKPIEHRGKRAPYMLTREQVNKDIQKLRSDLAGLEAYIRSEIRSSLESHDPMTVAEIKEMQPLCPPA